MPQQICKIKLSSDTPPIELEVYPILADGNCFYKSVLEAIQLVRQDLAGDISIQRLRYTVQHKIATLEWSVIVTSIMGDFLHATEDQKDSKSLPGYRGPFANIVNNRFRQYVESDCTDRAAETARIAFENLGERGKKTYLSMIVMDGAWARDIEIHNLAELMNLKIVRINKPEGYRSDMILEANLQQYARVDGHLYVPLLSDAGNTHFDVLNPRVFNENRGIDCETYIIPDELIKNVPVEIHQEELINEELIIHSRVTPKTLVMPASNPVVQGVVQSEEIIQSRMSDEARWNRLLHDLEQLSIVYVNAEQISSKPLDQEQIFLSLSNIGEACKKISWCQEDENCIRNKYGFVNRYKNPGNDRFRTYGIDFERLSDLKSICLNNDGANQEFQGLLISAIQDIRNDCEILRNKILIIASKSIIKIDASKAKLLKNKFVNLFNKDLILSMENDNLQYIHGVCNFYHDQKYITESSKMLQILARTKFKIGNSVWIKNLEKRIYQDLVSTYSLVGRDNPEESARTTYHGYTDEDKAFSLEMYCEHIIRPHNYYYAGIIAMVGESFKEFTFLRPIGDRTHLIKLYMYCKQMGEVRNRLQKDPEIAVRSYRLLIDLHRVIKKHVPNILSILNYYKERFERIFISDQGMIDYNESWESIKKEYIEADQTLHPLVDEQDLDFMTLELEVVLESKGRKRYNNLYKEILRQYKKHIISGKAVLSDDLKRAIAKCKLLYVFLDDDVKSQVYGEISNDEGLLQFYENNKGLIEIAKTKNETRSSSESQERASKLAAIDLLEIVVNIAKNLISNEENKPEKRKYATLLEYAQSVVTLENELQAKKAELISLRGGADNLLKQDKAQLRNLKNKINRDLVEKCTEYKIKFATLSEQEKVSLIAISGVVISDAEFAKAKEVVQASKNIAGDENTLLPDNESTADITLAQTETSSILPLVLLLHQESNFQTWIRCRYEGKMRETILKLSLAYVGTALSQLDDKPNLKKEFREMFFSEVEMSSRKITRLRNSALAHDVYSVEEDVVVSTSINDLSCHGNAYAAANIILSLIPLLDKSDEELRNYASSAARNESNYRIRIGLLNSIANAYKMLNQFEEANKFYKQALDICIQNKGAGSLEYANILRQVIISGSPLDDLDTLFDEALSIYLTENNLTGVCDLVIRKAARYQHMGRPREAVDFIEKMSEYFHEERDYSSFLKLNIIYANCVADLFDSEGAITIYEELLGTKYIDSFRFEKWEIYYNLAITYMDKGDLFQAEDFFRICIMGLQAEEHVFKEHFSYSYNQRIAELYMSYANCVSNKGVPKDAISKLTVLKDELAGHMRYMNLLVDINLFIADLYHSLEKYKEAQNYCRELENASMIVERDIVRKIRLERVIAINTATLGTYRPQSGLETTVRTPEFIQIDNISQIESYNALAKVYLIQKQFDKALIYNHMAIEIVTESKPRTYCFTWYARGKILCESAISLKNKPSETSKMFGLFREGLASYKNGYQVMKTHNILNAEDEQIFQSTVMNICINAHNIKCSMGKWRNRDKEYNSLVQANKNLFMHIAFDEVMEDSVTSISQSRLKHIEESVLSKFSSLKSGESNIKIRGINKNDLEIYLKTLNVEAVNVNELPVGNGCYFKVDEKLRAVLSQKKVSRARTR